MSPRGRPCASPKCGRGSSGGVTTTPPKTPAKSRSPRGSTSPHNGGGSLGGPLGAKIPYAVCEAITSAVWAHAKAQAEKASAAANSASASSSAAAPLELSPAALAAATPGKRRHPASGRSGSSGDARGSGDVICPRGCSQSQTQSTQDQAAELEPSTASSADEAVAQARAALGLVLDTLGGSAGSDSAAAAVAAEALSIVRKMSLAALAYWQYVSQDLSKAAASLARFLEHHRRLYWSRPPWRGVNLGGWLLLEPGPSDALFERYGPAECEWDLMLKMREKLGADGARLALEAHRNSFITEEDFRAIRALGLNAVRIPFGYWTVTGPSDDDVFVGPCMEHIDRAVAWCKAHGLQVMLDLHGAPGGESGERPCGRQRHDWHWQDWRFDGSIEALRIIAERYKGHPAVAAISVCNEPSERVPVDALCEFYDRACRTIRGAGMPPDEVAIGLPVYRTERLDEIWRVWNRRYDGFARHVNTAFDLHLYHCFGSWWQRQSLGQQLRMTKRHRKILRRVPAVVGEWSLALAPRARGGGEQPEEDLALRAFATGQLEAYGQASHGWFFWNWRDSQHKPEWDLNGSIERQWLTKTMMAHALVGSKLV